MEHNANAYENNHLFYIIDKCMKLGFLLHFTWSILFFILDIDLLGYINIFSSLIYLAGSRLNKKGYTTVTILIGHAEILLHAFVAVYILGSDSGFQYYILAAIIVTFIASTPQMKMKSIILFIDTVAFAVLSMLFKTPFIQIDSIVLSSFHFMNIILICLTLAIATYYFQKVTDSAEEKLIMLNKKLEVYANTDTLTNLLNRRSMIHHINKEVLHFNRYKKPYTFILTDIDNFKSFNDAYGHDCGDFVLKECASFLKDSLRRRDAIARWGGEEFLILLHETEQHEAYQFIERIRESLEEKTFHHQGVEVKISLTFGLSEYNESRTDVNQCINHADKALMKGKAQGKNCVVAM